MPAPNMSTGPSRSPSPLTRTEDKYEIDAAFRSVVDLLEMMIHKLELTPGEVREAAVYACMRVEMRRVRSYLVPLDPEIARQVLPNDDGNMCRLCGHPKNSGSCQRQHP